MQAHINTSSNITTHTHTQTHRRAFYVITVWPEKMHKRHRSFGYREQLIAMSIFYGLFVAYLVATPYILLAYGVS